MPKLSSFPTTQPVTDDMRFVGTFDNGDGTFTDYNVTTAQMIAFVSGQSRKTITAASTANSLSDSFFSEAITYFISNNQTYIIDVDFTQSLSGQIIAFIDPLVNFASGQVLIAFR